MTAGVGRLHARMRRVLDHIDRHLDDDLDLETISGVAAFSKHHFQRWFTATCGLSLHRYVQLARLKRASHCLAFRDRHTVTGIAMDAGYDAPDAFARAFRRRFGQSPSAFRSTPHWTSWLSAFGPLDDARSRIMHRAFTRDDVTIRDLSPTPVAIMEHRGDPATIGATLRRFIAWRKAAGLSPATSATFNVFHSDPRTTPPEEYRMDLCAATDRPFAARGESIVAGTIPGGRCAVLRVVGHTDRLEPAARYLLGDWLADSGEQARGLPLHCRRLTLFPEVPEHEAVADLVLPLR